MSAATETASHHQPLPDRSPPVTEVGLIGWLRKNLFSSISNTILTVLGIYLIWLVVPPILDWVIFDANFVGDSRDACTGSGACWVFIKVRISQFMYGFYPADERWRINLAGIIAVICIAWLVIERLPYKRYVGFFALVPFPILCYFLFRGGLGLADVETAKWGGLFLTLVISSVGIVASLPIGILLALGRRSELPVIRLLCTGFIEMIRGVPLITLLFMASVMLPLFLPEGVTFNKLARALVIVALFASAYIAEVVRGGLQAIPKGQYEAASAMGLTYWKSMMLIILPQALKLVIPGLVNTLIGLFKDTTLVLIIGLFDLLNIAQTAVTSTAWLGLANEGYFFVGLIFWIFCFGMSRYSIFLESKLDTGHSKR